MKTPTQLLTFALMLITLGVTAQSFNTTISFRNEMRTLSGFIPAGYDSAKPYTLIVGLHGLEKQ